MMMIFKYLTFKNGLKAYKLFFGARQYPPTHIFLKEGRRLVNNFGETSKVLIIKHALSNLFENGMI